MTPEEQIKKANLEVELYEHYRKIIKSMLHWCVYDQEPEIEVMTTAFGINKERLTLRALKDVLETWEFHEDNVKRS